MNVLIAKHIPLHSEAPKKKKRKNQFAEKFQVSPNVCIPGTKNKNKKIKKRKLSINDDIRDCSSHS